MPETLYGQPQIFAPGTGFDASDPYQMDEVVITGNKTQKKNSFDFESLFNALPNIIGATATAFGGNGYQSGGNQQPPDPTPKKDYTTILLIAGVLVALLVGYKLLK